MIHFYFHVNKILSSHMLSYKPICQDVCLVEQQEKSLKGFDSILDNDGNFGSVTCKHNNLKYEFSTNNFVNQRYITGLDKPTSIISKSGNVSYKNKNDRK